MVPEATIYVDAETRRRVSGPGLRTFVAIAERYGIERKDRILLLGVPTGVTYDEWVGKAYAGLSVELPADALLRISGILGIYKTLSHLFPVEAEAMTWLKGPHHAVEFGGRAPIRLMIEGGLEGILKTRRYLDVFCEILS